jgi:hypothetical protein
VFQSLTFLQPAIPLGLAMVVVVAAILWLPLPSEGARLCEGHGGIERAR